MSNSSISLTINSKPYAPGTLRFIYQKVPVPGGLNYRLEIPVHSIDPAVWESAGFDKFRVNDEDIHRNWFFWLGFVISRAFDPEETSDLQSVCQQYF